MNSPWKKLCEPIWPEDKHASKTLTQIVDETVKAIMDLELAALGDHCLSMQLQPILSTAITAAFKHGRIVQSR